MKINKNAGKTDESISENQKHRLRTLLQNKIDEKHLN